MRDELTEQRERRRLRALHRLEVLDTRPEAEFDALVKAAALVCGVPISLISLIDRDRQWFKANVGLEGLTETSRDVSFCTRTIEGPALLEVNDATKDARFADNPFVAGDPNIRFYAGVPLTLAGGENVGSLCVIDHKTKVLSPSQREILQHLADAATRALELRRGALHEKELLAVAAQSHSILQNSEDAILTMALDGTITQWNAAAERMFGYTAGEAKGASLSLILAPDTMAAESNPQKRLAAADRIIRTERVRKDGMRIPVSVSVGPVLSETGEVAGATEIIRDISEILATQLELAEAGRRLNRLYQATPAMLYAVDLDGAILSVSDRWLEVLGYRREEVAGRTLCDFMQAETAERLRESLLPVLLSEGHYEAAEGQLVTRAGKVLDVLISAILERDENGAPVRSIGVIDDITVRREAERARGKVEQALRDERQRLGQIIEGTRAGTWEWNVQTGENRVNALWAAMLGYSLDELQPADIDTFNNLVCAQDQTQTEARLEAHFSGKADHYENEFRMRHKDGHWVWIASRGRVLTWLDDGRPEWMFGTHQDISEKREEEERLRQSMDFLDRTGRIAGVGGWELDLVDMSVHWSNEICLIHEVPLGYVPTLEEAIQFYAPASRPLIQAAVEDCISTGKGWDLELQIVTATGRLVWVHAVGSASFENGRAVRLTGAFQDIDEKVAQRIALEEINNRFAIAVENGRIGVWDADLTTGKTLYSDMWCRLIGYTRDEISDDGDQWQAFLHPDDRERALAADKAHIRGEEPFFEENFRMRHKDGHWVWILDRGLVTARDEAGRPLRMIGTHTDITPQKQEEEERLLLGQRMAIAADNGGIGIWQVELASETVTWDAWMYRLYGLPDDTQEPLRDLWRRYTHPDDIERVSAAVRRAVDEVAPMEEEYRIIWQDGSIHHLHVSARLVRGSDGTTRVLVGAAWDVTEERQMALELAEQHALMQVTLNSIGDAVITTDADGMIQWLNPIAERMTGWSAGDARGEPSHRVFRIIHEETREQALDPIRACLDLRQVVGLPEDTVLVARNGAEFAIEDSCAPIRNAENEILGTVLVFHDVSEQRRLSKEMSYRASHDELTGLINRSEFERRLNRVFSEVRSGQSGGVLLYIDLDRFKIVNDSCGHSVGDDLLRKTSQIMQGSIRSGDTLARLGGDEFAAIIEHCTPEIAMGIAQKICDEIAEFRFVHDGKQYRIGASIGLAPIDHGSASVAAILQAADAACYAAKEHGRNRVHRWREKDELLVARAGETSWVSRIEQALQDDGFVLYAQKIVPLSRVAECTHVELLLRMRDGDGGIILPNAFLPAAERFNLATRIDRWVLSHAIRWMQEASVGANDLVSVNLSGQSIGDRSFHKFAYGVLDDAGPALCRTLCLEITETAVISNMVEAMDFIRAVRERGVLIALDDFGAGTSSFGYLKRFSIDFLKIDGQFAQGLLTHHPVDEATIRCFVEMARVLDIKTVAEFVSDDRIAEQLTEMGVDLAQGYAFHRPEPAAGIGYPASTVAESQKS